MARLGIEKKDARARPATYDAKHWRVLWTEMMKLALERCKHDSTLRPPLEIYVSSIHAAKGMQPHVQTKVAHHGHPSAHGAPSGHMDRKPSARGDLKPHPKRRFIRVPFKEKDEAKALGAKFDVSFKMWYVPAAKKRQLFRWPDELMPRFMRLTEPMPDVVKEPKRRLAPTSVKSTSGKAPTRGSSKSNGAAGARLAKEMDGRLKFLLAE